MDTRLYTITVPVAAPAASPAAIAEAPSNAHLRVVVRNAGGAMIFLGLSEGDVLDTSGVTSQNYRLPAGASDVFVIAPKQKILATGSGAAGLACVAISEAIPIEVK